jgi:N-acetylmuramoyl-L-alanine amidase
MAATLPLRADCCLVMDLAPRCCCLPRPGQTPCGMPHPAIPRGRPAGTLPLVMLDPGHGGKDPGAIGISGTYEKHVAFATAEELATRLTHSGRYRVALTRQTDDFIPLDDRVSIAQAKGAHLFMSIHADALTDHGVRGASVYTCRAMPRMPRARHSRNARTRRTASAAPTCAAFRRMSPKSWQAWCSMKHASARRGCSRAP